MHKNGEGEPGYEKGPFFHLMHLASLYPAMPLNKYLLSSFVCVGLC